MAECLIRPNVNFSKLVEWGEAKILGSLRVSLDKGQNVGLGQNLGPHFNRLEAHSGSRHVV